MTDIRVAFGQSLLQVRLARGVSQEELDAASTRNYIGVLERGERAVTLEKVDDLAGQLGMHPLSLLTLAYAKVDRSIDLQALQQIIRNDLRDLPEAPEPLKPGPSLGREPKFKPKPKPKAKYRRRLKTQNRRKS